MDIIIFVFVLLVIFGIAQSISQWSEVSRTRELEKQKMHELSDLKKKASELKKEIQDYQIGKKIPKIESMTSKPNSMSSTSEVVRCYFCDERIFPNSLICKECKNPNYNNLESVMNHELNLVQALTSEGSRHV